MRSIVALVSATVIGGCARPDLPPAECSTARIDSMVVADTNGLALSIFELPRDEPKGGSSANVFLAGRSPRIMSVMFIEAAGRVTERYVLADSLNFMFERTERPTSGSPRDSVHRRVYVCNGGAVHGESTDTARNHVAIVARRLRVLDTLFAPIVALSSRKAGDTTIWFDSTKVPEGTHGRAPVAMLVLGSERYLIDYGFSDSVKRLHPNPGIVPNEDAHSDDHGEKTWCYAFADGYVRLIDNGFVANVEVRRGSPPAKSACPFLSTAPAFEVAGVRLTLATPPRAISDSLFPEFGPLRDPGYQGLTRDWWSYGRSISGEVQCLWETLVIATRVKDGALDVLGVQTGGELGRAGAKPVRGYPADSVYSCG